MTTPGVGTYVRTLRYLKWRQLFGRLWFRNCVPLAPSGTPEEICPARPTWVVPARRLASFEPPQRLTFLHVSRDLDVVGWDATGQEPLWRYNLHYFDDLNAIGAADRAMHHAQLIDRWLSANPPVAGVGWEPYPTSLRIVNWIKWLRTGVPSDAAWVASLWLQASWLAGRVEHHLLGNHLFANAKALLFAGTFFAGPRAARWRTRAAALLRREIVEQILPDGGQFERSPMYQALALEDLLDLVNLLRARPDPERDDEALLALAAQRIPAMLRWLSVMSHPDGTLVKFNDTAEDIAPATPELLRYAADLDFTAPPPPGAGLVHLADSGYVRVAAGPATAFLDVAPIGADYQPGHAHADTLSFELSVAGQRVVVNGGTSCYGLGPQRLFERSTAAHSTLELCGADSSEVWSGFRVGRRARPRLFGVGPCAGGWQVDAAHDGYTYLRGRPEHRRRWCFGANEMTVDDQVSVPGLPGVARYLLAPHVRVTRIDGQSWQLTVAGCDVARVTVEAGAGSVASATAAIRFGAVEPTCALVVMLDAGHARTRWTWNPNAHSLPD